VTAGSIGRRLGFTTSDERMAADEKVSNMLGGNEFAGDKVVMRDLPSVDRTKRYRKPEMRWRIERGPESC
jgi:hypothetical protein